MNDAELLRRELRGAREELVRKRARQSDDLPTSESQLPLMPERDAAFLRLALMSVDDLETHIDRLERDLADLEDGIDRPDTERE
ncbi:hypothetical protein B9H04_12210 [Halorubrum ezzemoulense DSM 17463]|uniref:Uncharacterized protein n=4 Tax=Halorubrum ezzemoulense TaxID=337243 RepID=A0A1X4GKN3_HALEZ|nr:hypothetical protein [Halorubrum ezzemoulense]TKX40375.1 hypothetical protein EXE52_06385 [Halorubrum sp. CGM4_25_10-8A]TKX64592.1 hypothetical protein EXE47_10345 [Halorubrum sp. GN12_10-3_MGM]MDB2272777.1 hypothetical protein [Halorubrum ezzemoulense]MDB2275743.1 hypothetical protein [Halorubrum ezzemoulense]MDB2293936.1 hypothetical protein [Halorubrum ezzemoulense]